MTHPPGDSGSPVADRSDADLLSAVAEERASAQRDWAELVRRHSARMYAVARSFGLDVQPSEDLVQVAWLRLLERGHQVRDGSALRPWLCAIVRNEALKIVTRRREIPTDLPLDQFSHPAEDGLSVVLAAERAQAVRLAFTRLSEDCRQLLRLSIADPPLSYDEIAIAMGRPRGSLGPTRRRCLDRLRQTLPAGFAGGPEPDTAADVSRDTAPGSIRRDGASGGGGPTGTGH